MEVLRRHRAPKTPVVVARAVRVGGRVGDRDDARRPGPRCGRHAHAADRRLVDHGSSITAPGRRASTRRGAIRVEPAGPRRALRARSRRRGLEDGAGGGPTMTGRPRSRAASSLAIVWVPPLSLGDDEVDAVAVDQGELAFARAQGPGRGRPRAAAAAAGQAGRRADEERASWTCANAARPWRPVVSRTRVPRVGRVWPPRAGRRPGASDPRRARPTRPLEAAEAGRRPPPRFRRRRRDALGERMGGVDDRDDAMLLQPPRGGCGPPKPPIRTSPTGSRGFATRPASEVVRSAPSSCRTPASSRASAVRPG